MTATASRPLRPYNTLPPDAHTAQLSLKLWEEIADMPLASIGDASAAVALRDLIPLGIVQIDRDCREKEVSFPLGLSERVTQLLKEVGSRGKLTVGDSWLTPWNEESIRQDAALSTVQGGFLEAIAWRRHALVVAYSMADQLELLEALGDNAALKHILVAGSNEGELMQAAGHLARHTRRPITAHEELFTEKGISIHFAVARDSIRRNPREFELTVWLGGDAPVMPTRQDLRGRSQNARWLALIRQPTSCPTPLTALSLEAFFGSAVYETPLTPPEQLGGRVIWLPGAGMMTQISSIEWARELTIIGENRDRNELVAHVAVALSSSDASSWRMFRFDRDVNEVFARQSGPGQSVAIIVQNAAHGRRVRALLPDWPLVTSRANTPSPGVVLPRSIITLQMARGRQPQADVVINAAGSSSRWIDGCFPHESGLGETSLVVDFADASDEPCQAQCRARYRDYLRRGCSVYGLPPWMPQVRRPPSLFADERTPLSA